MRIRSVPAAAAVALMAFASGLSGCGEQSTEPAQQTAAKPAAQPAAKPAAEPAPPTPAPPSPPAAPAATAVQIDVVDASGTRMTGDPVRGATIFKQCLTCHTLEAGKNKVGPTLFGIIGRPAGSVEGYNYSDANKNSGIVWSEQQMFEYLEDPRATIPGTKMAFAGLKKPQDRADVIAYIQSQSE